MTSTAVKVRKIHSVRGKTKKPAQLSVVLMKKKRNFEMVPLIGAQCILVDVQVS